MSPQVLFTELHSHSSFLIQGKILFNSKGCNWSSLVHYFLRRPYFVDIFLTPSQRLLIFLHHHLLSSTLRDCVSAWLFEGDPISKLPVQDAERQRQVPTSEQAQREVLQRRVQDFFQAPRQSQQAQDQPGNPDEGWQRFDPAFVWKLFSLGLQPFRILDN